LPLAACRLPLAACRLPLAACRLPLAAWHVAGWLKGPSPAMFGRRALNATIAPVKIIVNHQYHKQIDHL